MYIFISLWKLKRANPKKWTCTSDNLCFQFSFYILFHSPIHLNHKIVWLWIKRWIRHLLHVFFSFKNICHFPSDNWFSISRLCPHGPYTQQWPHGDHTASRHVAGYMQMQFSSNGMDKSRRPKIDATRKCMSWNGVVQSIKHCTMKEGSIMYHKTTLVTTRDQMAPLPPPLTSNQNIPKHLSSLVYPPWKIANGRYL